MIIIMLYYRCCGAWGGCTCRAGCRCDCSGCLCR